ncbi:glycosyltransferase [Cellulosimicrobium cellulans]|uniref:glycosyltransferase n=1 Tax=Cellulosimicrobium cellulans TaxID=1710 RepID=UPI001112FACB|nr:glycosyltransferase family 4 protein [Cellulosimicrobium cellulans]
MLALAGPLRERIASALPGIGAELPLPVEVPEAPVRLYVAPANYAGQGFAWARAVEKYVPGAAARNMAAPGDSAYGYQTDYLVPRLAYTSYPGWSARQWRAVRRFSHVLVEAELLLFPGRGDGSLLSEVASLRRAGLQVATICHGSDVRPPAVHARSTRWSPFLDPAFRDVEALERSTARNLRTLEALRDQGVPAFVSTPALLEYVPWATWCPVVVDVEQWRTDEAPLRRDVPVVVHAPSKGVMKGTSLIEPELIRLHQAGIIEYRRAEGLDRQQMVELYRGADIVLDSFRTGNYGAATCEALAAGRLVIARIDAQVRATAERARGASLPVVEADPESLGGVLQRIVTNRGYFREVAAQGPEFVRGLHDGAASARALAPFLARPAGDRP